MTTHHGSWKARAAASLAAIAFVALVAAAAPRAQSSHEDPLGAPVVDVERVKTKKGKHPSLTFLKENREFFRARLDQLRMTAGENREGAARDLDPRYAMLQSMLDDILAAQDSAAAGENWIRERGLLESVSNLGELEAQMDAMERLLADQSGRLQWLEEDFVGRQKTSLVVLLRGIPSAMAPAGVLLRTEDGETHHIDLGESLRESLAIGGAAELLHEFVEPRHHVYEISFEGEQWTGHEPYVVHLEPTRDRTTFLELDLGGVLPAHPEAGLSARSWVR